MTLVVACGSDFNAVDPAASSGIAYVDLGVASPAEVRRQSVVAFDNRPLVYYSGIANAGALGFGVTFGKFGGLPKDQLWAFDTVGGTARKVADASDSFTFGPVLIDAARGVVYLADAFASQPRVHIYTYSTTAAPALQTSINANPSLGLPPQQIGWY
jgi:hypothetical protein